MNVCIDIGNTRTKVGYFENGKLLNVQRIPAAEKLFDFLRIEDNDRIIISSVVKSIDELKLLFKNYPSVLFLNSDSLLPIKNNYASPKTLGYDRIAAAIGATVHFPGENVLVIDIGTAVKYDFVDFENTFVGGIISPGKRMRFKALNTFTQKLPLLDTDDIPELIGNNTESCMKSGVMNGLLAEINGIIEEYQKKVNFQIITTGGDAPYFESRIKYPTFAAPNLVLEGLNRILEYNVI
ncbi:MAG: type III pantothenate kinase [Cytophagaceae bacterium]|nr:type III pantothenate kinase [Cytophagaceae bacterium]MBK9510333.1 type III pantothenate kinase [Cytophagaceae bacterium]MBK9933093.1 type III pantothenate kinase [Cytophagaceae bacterium]MBL0303189.1 type III pantothenate kinase [Cytophagaceae bacterium]MBL0326039.1 type III pantothenate kinase [Cytophagaceae bacterium]